MTETMSHEWFERQVIGLLDDLLGAAMRLAKNRHDAEDLVAESVSKAWGSRESLKEAGRFRPWIFRILTNCFLTDCRKRAVRPAAEVSVDPVPDEQGEAFSLFEELHQPFLLWWSNPEQEFLNKLLRKDLERAVDGLPEAYRTVVVLADLEGLAYAEIAESLDIPVGTVRSRLARARAQLQKALWIHAQEAGLTKPADAHQEASHEVSQDDRV
ncbi:MAG: sigma-70 family RNA polymerase sigma factor [Nitrospirota bacterium]